jgi:hypothetical protein
MIVILASHKHDRNIISEAKRHKVSPRILPCISTLPANVALRRTGRQLALRIDTLSRVSHRTDLYAETNLQREHAASNCGV